MASSMFDLGELRDLLDNDLQDVQRAAQAVPKAHNDPAGSVVIFGPEWRAQAALKKDGAQLLATLEGLGEVIKEQNLSPTPAFYLALLFNALQGVCDSDVRHKRDTYNTIHQRKQYQALQAQWLQQQAQQQSLMRLMAVAIAALPLGVVVKKARAVGELLVRIVNGSLAEFDTLRRALGCVVALATQLARFPKAAPDVKHVLSDAIKVLASLSFDNRQKIRKIAHSGCLQALSEATSYTKPPITALITQFCERMLTPSGDTMDMAYLLNLLRSLAPVLPSTCFTAISRRVLTLVTHGNTVVAVMALCALHALSTSAAATAVLLKEVWEALLEKPVPVEDPEHLAAFCDAVCVVFSRLANPPTAAIWPELLRVVRILLRGFASPHEKVHAITAASIHGMLKDAVTPEVLEAAACEKDAGDARSPAACLRSVLDLALGTLHLTLQSAWPAAITLMRLLFTLFGRQGYPLLAPHLKTLNDMRVLQGFPKKHIKTLNTAIGAAIAAMGPASFLQVLPLNITDAADVDRTWLLPLLKTHIQNTDLAFFADSILPITVDLKNLAAEAAAQGLALQEKSNLMLRSQLVYLLPSFCRGAVDVAATMPRLLPALTALLAEDADLREPVCSALGLLVKEAQRNSRSEADDVSARGAADVKCLSALAPKVLPLLCNLFEVEATRPHILHALHATVQVASAEAVNNLFKQAMRKLLADDTGGKGLLLDLSLCFVTQLNEKNTSMLFRAVKPLAKDADPKVQKKTLKVIKGILATHADFAKKNMDAFVDAALKPPIGAAHVTTRKAKLRCLSLLLSGSSEEEAAQLMRDHLTDTILCTKAGNVRMRTCAYDALLAFPKCLASEPAEAGEKFLGLLVAGLAGTTPHMVSATISAIARVMFEYPGLREEVFAALMDSVAFLITNTDREVQRAAVDFIRIANKCAPRHLVEERLQKLVPALLEHCEHSHSRERIKFLLDKLCRKFGYGVVEAAAPEGQRRLIHSLGKANQRRRNRIKKAKSTADSGKSRSSRHQRYEELLAETAGADGEEGGSGSEDDAGSEDEVDSAPATRAGRGSAHTKSKGGNVSTWYVEGGADGADEPLDLMGGQLAAQVSLTNPAHRTSKKDDDSDSDSDIQMGDDGRLIIGEQSSRKRFKKSKADTKGVKPASTVSLADVDDYQDNDDLADDDHQEQARMQEDKGTSRKRKAGDMARKPLASNVRYTGDDYRSKKGKGDVLRKESKYQPFAYVKLDPGMLNKRKAKKASAQFEGVVGAARRGAAKGRRAR